jgi:hypothetical protein
MSVKGRDVKETTLILYVDGGHVNETLVSLSLVVSLKLSLQ